MDIEGLKVVSVNDVFDSIMADRKRWVEEKRVGTVSFDETDNCILFHRNSETKNYRYWISLSRLESSSDALQWLNHLRHKRWFTKEVMNDFMDALERLGIVAEGV